MKQKRGRVGKTNRREARARDTEGPTKGVNVILLKGRG